MVKLLSSLSHLIPSPPSKIQSTIASVTQSRPSLPIPNIMTTIKNNPKSSLAALTVAMPLVGAVVLAVENKDKIKSTLGKAADTVKKEVAVIKKETIAVAGAVEKKTIAVAGVVEKGVVKVGKVAVSGLGNMMTYGMIAIGGLILLKFII